MASSHRPSRSRKRKLTLSSDSEEDNSPAETDGKSQRRSSRILDKQHKPEFRLPSREKIWNDIPSVTTTPQLTRLTPKKTVNNFTKVYNNYNYDDYEDTSDDDDSSIETSDSGEEKEKQHRIKNYHRRLKVASSSSDEDDGKLDGPHREPLQAAECLLKDKDTGDSLAVKDVTRSQPLTDSKSDPGHTASPAAAGSEDSDASDVLSPCKNAQFRNRSVLLSDDDSTENDDNADDIGDSHDDSDHVSESSDSNSPQESRRCTLEKQKLKHLNMFQKLRDAHAKRKSSLAKT
ncbi:hypothetical protein BsWGS_05557 [Bradybaena similaris]